MSRRRGPNRFWTVVFEGTEVSRSDEGILLDTGQLVPSRLATPGGPGAIVLSVSDIYPGDNIGLVAATEECSSCSAADRDLCALQDALRAAADSAHADHCDPRPYCPDPICRLAADVLAGVPS